MQLPYSSELNIEYLGRLFANTNECYKFFWFKAILEKVTKNQLEMTYEELVDSMIADAWYMVTEYHLNLGPVDTLENVIDTINKMYPEIKPAVKESELLALIKDTDNREIITKKRTLTRNVPYRLQAPFLNSIKGKAWNVGESKLIEQINQQERLMYYFTALNGLDTRIHVDEDWAKYIIKNQEIIRGWLENNMILYLQKRNPCVPGIADKLYPPKKRKLSDVKKYWKMIIELEPVREIYNDELLTDKDISIDHFIPWSYVAHDELWNLSPTTRSINSSKSNSLPKWEIYYDKLLQQEYQVYRLLWKYDALHKEFDKLAKEHINDKKYLNHVYDKEVSLDTFANELYDNLRPLYQSAKNCGFQPWNYQGVAHEDL